jgi:hypothetical protein
MSELPTHALTLRNPWPWFHFHVPLPFRKLVENRSRNLGFRREFWFHTSKESTREDWVAACEAARLAGVPLEHFPDGKTIARVCPDGCIVARVVCIGIIHPPRIPELPLVSVDGNTNAGGVRLVHDLRYSPWYFGKWGYVIESFTLVKPVPCTGARGFWRVPLDVLKQIQEAA